MHCEIGGTQGSLGYVSALGATRFVHWLILVAPSCLRSHNARYIMLKSLNNTSGNLWHFFVPCPFLKCTYTYVYRAWSLTLVHLSSAIPLTQICICIQSLLCMLLLFGWPPCQRSDMIWPQIGSGGLPACLCCDSLYIRIIWSLVRLRNLC